jgi:hypothetical protein
MGEFHYCPRGNTGAFTYSCINNGRQTVLAINAKHACPDSR